MYVFLTCILEFKYKDRLLLSLSNLPFICVLDFAPGEIMVTYNYYLYVCVCI